MRYDPTSSARLAIDLGATKFALAHHDREGSITVSHRLLPREGTATADFAHIADTLTAAAGRFGGTAVLCSAPSVDALGTVDEWPNRAYWREFPLLERMQDALKGPVMIVPDGEAVALADPTALAAELVVSLWFGTGIAGAVLRNGETVRSGPTGAELGHVITDPGGRSCACGDVGCLQATWTAYRRGVAELDELVGSLTRFCRLLSRMLPGAVVVLGGRLVEGGVGLVVMDGVRSRLSAVSGAPTLRCAAPSLNGPLDGGLALAHRLGRARS